MTARPTNPDLVAAQLATRCHGVITRAEARRAGLSDRQIDYRIATGRWRRLARGVFALNGSPQSWQQALYAACTAAGAFAAASHLSAAALEGLAPSTTDSWITVPAGDHHRSGTVHRSPLPARDVSVIDRIRVTTVPRTIVDCAMVCGDRQLAGIVDDALTRKLCTCWQIRGALLRVEAQPGRRGSGRLRRVLEAWDGAIAPESPAEARLLRRIWEWDLPSPVLQHVVVDPQRRFVARVDLAWPDHHLALEYDGMRHHGPSAWASDEERHESLVRLGWEVRHVERDDLVHGSGALRRFLGRRLR